LKAPSSEESRDLATAPSATGQHEQANAAPAASAIDALLDAIRRAASEGKIALAQSLTAALAEHLGPGNVADLATKRAKRR
jgi:hypothetical protein